MERIIEARTAIYDFFETCKSCQDYLFDPANEDEFHTYNTSMYLLQDTSEAIFAHREKGFSNDPLQSYIEFWGVMQAVFIQQDSLGELYEVICREKLQWGGFHFWSEIRGMRNMLAGHSSKNDHPPKHGVRRSFIGRKSIKYGGVRFETYTESGLKAGEFNADSGITTTGVFNLGNFIYRYAGEAEGVLKTILSRMEKRWE